MVEKVNGKVGDQSPSRRNVLIRQHRNATNSRWNPSIGEELVKELGPFKTELDDLSVIDHESLAWEDIENFLSTIGSDERGSQVLAFEEDGEEMNQTEKNLNDFFEQSEKIIPLLKAFPSKEKERAWKLQLDQTKRYLNDRLWTQKVIMVRKQFFFIFLAKRNGTIERIRSHGCIYQRSQIN